MTNSIFKNSIYNKDSLEGLRALPSEAVNMCITSPPYFRQRDYGVDGQIGLEETPAEYIDQLIAVFREVKRILRPDGTLWINIGDSYCAPTSASKDQLSSTLGGGKNTQIEAKKRPNKKPHGSIKQKDLIGIPWELAFALRADGWYLRQDIIWEKPNAMPESVKDRCTKCHEYIFLLSKTDKYYFDYKAIMETAKGMAGGKKEQNENEKRRKRSVWSIPTKPFKEAHFAAFPEKLIEPCILAGCPAGGIVIDPFIGSGTTAISCIKLGRDYIGFEINSDYCGIAERRIKAELSQKSAERKSALVAAPKKATN